MNDFERDVRQKGRIAAGARCRKAGSKSRRCTLPHEHLTPAQLRGRNGRVRVFRMNRPMDAAAWSAMPEDLQKEYIRALRRRYHVSQPRLAEMLGLSRGALKERLTALGLWDSGGHGMSAAQVRAWERWLGLDEEKEDAGCKGSTKM